MALGTSASAPLVPLGTRPPRGMFKPLPGGGEPVRLFLAPRRAMPEGGSPMATRVQVLLNQLSFDSADVKRAAVQELSLLASTSNACRLAILAAKGDKKLVRLLRTTDAVPLLRWSVTALNALAVDDWSRQRQSSAIERILSVCGRGASSLVPSSEEDRMVVEAARLLANLLHAAACTEAFERLGGRALLSRWSAEPQSSLVEALCIVGLIQRPLRGVWSPVGATTVATTATQASAAQAASKAAAAAAAAAERGELLSAEQLEALRGAASEAVVEAAARAVADGQLLSHEELSQLRAAVSAASPTRLDRRALLEDFFDACDDECARATTARTVPALGHCEAGGGGGEGGGRGNQRVGTQALAAPAHTCARKRISRGFMGVPHTAIMQHQLAHADSLALVSCLAARACVPSPPPILSVAAGRVRSPWASSLSCLMGESTTRRVDCSARWTWTWAMAS